ncbi:MAG: ketopantoate reductase family protein, partial [Candidatus Hodarchaeota archaeon]
MKIAIVGAGAIGSLFAGYLARLKVKVGIIARKWHGDAIVSNGLEVNRIFAGRSFNVKKIRVLTGFEELWDYDLILISVKTFDLFDVLKKLKDAKIIEHDRHCIGLLQNGLGNENVVRAIFPQIPIIRFITSNGAFLQGPSKVIHTGLGNTYVGSWDKANEERLKPLMELFKAKFEEASNPVHITSEIKAKTWEKAIINCGINPVGAIFKVPNGIILKIPELKQISEKIIQEALQVAEKGNFLKNFDGLNATFEVMKNTAKNKNSMLQDLEHNRITLDWIDRCLVRKQRILVVN